jgi:3'-phosphoadenosine 5'-phosphosulfate sulfotransferase (PAPS reductase)/FAD synthetase
MKNRINYIGISGGKDSTATLLWALHASGYERESLHATFCDTGNEAPETYKYITYLSEAVFPIITLEPPLDFYELAKKKSRFPSAKARFCTQALKMEPTRLDVLALLQDGHEVVMHTGVRRSESEARSNLEIHGFDDYHGIPVIRPILDWTTAQVFAYIALHGVNYNPLYDKGMERVGCYPCIFSRKNEMALIAVNSPERIDFLEEKEKELGHTFFSPTYTAQKYRSLEVKAKDGRKVMVPTIRDVERWATDGYYAKQAQARLFEDEGESCSSVSGLCE